MPKMPYTRSAGSSTVSRATSISTAEQAIVEATSLSSASARASASQTAHTPLFSTGNHSFIVRTSGGSSSRSGRIAANLAARTLFLSTGNHSFIVPTSGGSSSRSPHVSEDQPR